jgi:hypothetical protein
VSDEIEFREPPEPGRAGPRAKHAAIAAQLHERPGQWALVDHRASSALAASAANDIRNARNLRAYEPAGSFEAVSRTEDGAHNVYARYVGVSHE